MNDVGLVLVNDGMLPAYDRSIAALVHGLEERLLERDVRVLTRIVASARSERAVYRTWRRSAAVDAVVLMDVRINDQRVALLRELELPFVAVTDRSRINGFSAVTLDTESMVATVCQFLVDRGYDRIVYVRAPGGPTADLGALRAAEFRTAGSDRVAVDVVLASTSTSEAAELAVQAAGAMRCAVVLDDDVSAVGAMDRFKRAGLRVPEDVAVFVWNDSPLCQTTDPAISALNARADVVGDLVGVCLLRSADETESIHLAAPAPYVVARASA